MNSQKMLHMGSERNMGWHFYGYWIKILAGKEIQMHYQNRKRSSSFSPLQTHSCDLPGDQTSMFLSAGWHPINTYFWSPLLVSGPDSCRKDSCCHHSHGNQLHPEATSNNRVYMKLGHGQIITSHSFEIELLIHALASNISLATILLDLEHRS